MKKLEGILQELESKISKQDLINHKISKSTVGWQIEHILLTINLIIGAIKKSNPNEYKWKFSFPRLLIFTMNKIPRGRAQAPKIVQPKDNFTVESLKKHLELAKKNIHELNSLKKNHHFDHPYFGKLNLKPTIKFLEIHTKHHLEIINDIIKSGK